MPLWASTSFEEFGLMCRMSCAIREKNKVTNRGISPGGCFWQSTNPTLIRQWNALPAERYGLPPPSSPRATPIARATSASRTNSAR